MASLGDKRLDFIEKYCTLSLHIKPDKWSKFATNEEVLAMLNEFYEKADVQALVITLNPTGQLIPCLGFPSALKNKAVYFVKKKNEHITKDNFLDVVLVGDLSPTPVEQMMAVVEEVIYSLFMKSENLAGWPRVVADDVIQQAHRLKNEMFVMGGKIKGKTLLPLPEHLDTPESTVDVFESLSGAVDSSLLHSIETIIIDWSHQIRDILSKDSAQPLLDGLHPLPKVEFEFWYSRQVNLQCINEQLYAPQVKKIADILERAKSCYWPALKNVFKDVSAGLKEAEDINLYLQPLKVLIEEIEQTEYPQLPPVISSVMYTVCLIWANSEYYNIPSRIIVILQEICNLFIEMTRNFLSPEEVLKGLQGEIEEVLGGIKLGITVIERLYKTYDACCTDLMPTFFKDKEPQYWEFPSTLIFTRMNSFYHRLKTIEELYVTSIEFLKLEKIELGGVRGNILGCLVLQIYEEVLELVKVFAECKYDPLDPADEQFDEDFAEFQIKIQDLDRRLATIFYQGFVDSSGMESAIKSRTSSQKRTAEFPVSENEQAEWNIYGHHKGAGILPDRALIHCTPQILLTTQIKLPEAKTLRVEVSPLPDNHNQF